MATAPETTDDQLHNPPRESSDSPTGIAALFNRFFCLRIYSWQSNGAITGAAL